MDVQRLRELIAEQEAQQQPEPVPADQPGTVGIGDAFQERLAKLEKVAQEMRTIFFGAGADRGHFPHEIQRRDRAVEQAATLFLHQTPVQPTERFIPPAERFPMPVPTVPAAEHNRVVAENRMLRNFVAGLNNPDRRKN